MEEKENNDKPGSFLKAWNDQKKELLLIKPSEISSDFKEISVEKNDSSVMNDKINQKSLGIARAMFKANNNSR